MDQSSSLLLNTDGLSVDRVVRNDVGRWVVHWSTDPQFGLGVRCVFHRAEVVGTACPRDVLIGENRPLPSWRRGKGDRETCVHAVLTSSQELSSNGGVGYRSRSG